MVIPVYEVVAIDGLRPPLNRSIVFLRETQLNQLNAFVAFLGLSAKCAREVRSRFDHWIDGNVHKHYHHGWPGDSPHNGCYVFKWKERMQWHRLYGFIHHPYAKINSGFQVCVLCTHATKNQWETDPRELDGALALSNDPVVRGVLSLKFPEKRE